MNFRQAARTVINAIWLFLAPRPTPGFIKPLLFPSTVSAVALLVCCLIFTPKLGLIGMLGALAPYWETGRPFWARIRNAFLVTAGLCGAMSIGVLASPFEWAIFPVSVLAVLLLGMIYQTFMLTAGPSPCMLFYAAVIGTYFGAQPHAGWNLVGVTAFASLLSSLLMALPLLRDIHSPERNAVSAAEQAVARFKDTPCTGSQSCNNEQMCLAHRGQRNAAYASVAHAGLMLHSSWPADRGNQYEDLTRRTEITAGSLVAETGDSPHTAPVIPRAVLGRPGFAFLIRRAVRPHSMEWFVTWRMGLAALLAGSASIILGNGHQYWAVLTATIVINQWADKSTSVRRAAHRTVGTLIGVGITMLIEACEPSEWVSVALVILAMLGMYLLLPMNYALALVFVTPMALLCVGVSSAGLGATTATSDRLLDTAIGAIAATLVMAISGWGFPRRLVEDQSARTASAMDSPRCNGQPSAPLKLMYELTHHHNVLERATNHTPALMPIAQREFKISDAGYRQLAKIWPASQDATEQRWLLSGRSEISLPSSRRIFGESR